MIERIIAANWVTIGFVVLASLVAHVCARIAARKFQLRPLPELAAWLVAVWPIYFCLTTLVGPPFYDWQYRAKAEKLLAGMPLYRVLMEHDPVAREALLKATVKIPRQSDQMTGMIEIGAIVTETMRRYLPVASDHSVTDLVGKLLIVMNDIQRREPERCILLLDDPPKAWKGWRSPHMWPFLEAAERVVLSGMFDPQEAPDQSWADARLKAIVEMLTESGNLLVTDPSQITDQYAGRACQEIYDLYRAALKVLPPVEIGPFFRAVLPMWLEPDSA